MTDAEQTLWYQLRAKRFENVHFKRQHPLAGYIVDFVAITHKMVIEADGGQHLESKRDACRDEKIKAAGYRVLRFWNHDILNNMEGVLEAIRLSLLACTDSSLPPAGERARAARPAYSRQEMHAPAARPLPYPSPVNGGGNKKE